MLKNLSAEKTAEKLTEYWKPIAAAAVLVVVAIALLGVWNELRARKDREATNALYEAQVVARKLVDAKNFEEAEKTFAPLIEKFSGTRAAFEAELQVGDIWMDAGNFPRATEHYNRAANMTKDPFSRLLAQYNIGVAAETAGKPQEAVAAYESALGVQGSEFLRPEILMAQARCYEALNQAAKAIEIYKTVQEKYSTRAYYSGAASAYEKLLSAKQL